MTDKLELTLLNRQPEIARLQDSLERFAQQHAIPKSKLHEVQLALEEHLTNIVRYGHTEEGEHRIKVVCRFAAQELQIQIEDDGRPFNPLEHPAPDLRLPIEKKPVGGLGIYMMKKSVDGMEYRREDDRNVLRLTKRI